MASFAFIGLIPIIIMTGVGSILFIDYWASQEAEYCNIVTTPIQCDPEYDRVWTLLQIWPYFFVMWSAAMMLALNGFSFYFTKKCPKCNTRVGMIRGKNKQLYYNCKKDGIILKPES